MALRAVFDANVLISALVFRGVPGQCLAAVETGRVEIVTCSGILADVSDKLEVKFGHTPDERSDKLAWLVQNSTQVEPLGELQGISRDPDDDSVLECAVAANAQFLVTGDADLLAVKSYQGIVILTPREFLIHLEAHAS